MEVKDTLKISHPQLLTISLILLVGMNSSYASETIQGRYCYTYGDSESIKDARAIAKSLAIRNAIESYRVYVSSSTNVKDFTLTEDMVRVLSSGYLKNIKIINSSEEDRKICYEIRATVDPKAFDAALKKEIEKATKDEKKIESDKREEDAGEFDECLKIVNSGTRLIHNKPYRVNHCYYYAEIKKVKKCGYTLNAKIKVKTFDDSGHVIGIREGYCFKCKSLGIGETTEATVSAAETIDGTQKYCPQYKIWLEK